MTDTATTITSRKSGAASHVLTATFADGDTATRRTTKVYPFLVVASYVDSDGAKGIWIVKGTRDAKVAARATRDRYGCKVDGRVILTMGDDTYTTHTA